jgi:hypothetical protein
MCITNRIEATSKQLRAEETTELFIASVSYPIIKNFGRWKSNGVLCIDLLKR